MSIPRALQSSIDNNEMIETIHIGEFSEEEEMTLAWTSRSAAIFSLVGGGYIFYWAWKRRDHVYHRLMLGRYNILLQHLDKAACTFNAMAADDGQTGHTIELFSVHLHI